MSSRKVIFPDPDVWTLKDPMANQPATVNRRLTDDERDLLAQLTVWVIAEQTGITDDEAAEVAEELNRDIGLHMQGDTVDVTVTTGNGHTIFHCTREWLAFHAHANDGTISSAEIRRHVHYYKPEAQR